jgi:hypothetical protein
MHGARSELATVPAYGYPALPSRGAVASFTLAPMGTRAALVRATRYGRRSLLALAAPRPRPGDVGGDARAPQLTAPLTSLGVRGVRTGRCRGSRRGAAQASKERLPQRVARTSAAFIGRTRIDDDSGTARRERRVPVGRHGCEFRAGAAPRRLPGMSWEPVPRRDDCQARAGSACRRDDCQARVATPRSDGCKALGSYARRTHLA